MCVDVRKAGARAALRQVAEGVGLSFVPEENPTDTPYVDAGELVLQPKSRARPRFRGLELDNTMEQVLTGEAAEVAQPAPGGFDRHRQLRLGTQVNVPAFIDDDSQHAPSPEASAAPLCRRLS